MPKGCPLVMADFAAGQWQVKFQQRPQSDRSVAPWISLVPYTEDARKTQDKPGIKATEVPRAELRAGGEGNILSTLKSF